MSRTNSEAQNGVNFDFEVKFDLEGQGQSHPTPTPNNNNNSLFSQELHMIFSLQTQQI